MLPSSVLALAHAQEGIVATRQLARLGMTADAIRANVVAERWQRVYRGVLATFTGELTLPQRQWAVCLAGGDSAAVSHASAAHLHGLGDEPDVVHVVVPAARGARRLSGALLHRSRLERRPVGSPPRTSVADTLCDLAAEGLRGDRLAAVTARAVQQRLVRPAQVLAALDGRGRAGNRGSADLAALVADVRDGAHSALEIRYLRDVERAHRLPRGERQQRVRRAGTTAYRDVVYVGRGLVVELDGRLGHDGLSDRFRDLTRDQLAAAAGEVTLRFGFWDVAGSPCVVAAQVAAVLRVEPRVCGIECVLAQTIPHTSRR